MKTIIKDLFRFEKTPRRGLILAEWVMLGYLLLTLLVVLFCYTKVQNPEAMIWGRIRVLATTLLMWGAYRLLPCPAVMLLRVGVQLALLSWWYPDTYEINRMLPNLDHLFAAWEQQLFGFQPALLFSQALPGAVFSELMDLGYTSYFPMIAVVTLFFFFFRRESFEKAAFIILGAFFIYYVVFDFVPVAGPTFYYAAVGVDDIARGVFPNVYDYFNHCQECLPSPGYTDGVFYQLVEDTKAAGERPTAAFPSSHVGVSTLLMWMVGKAGGKRLLLVMLPFYVLLCLATVYIQAHYAIDALAGFVSGTILFWLLYAIYPRDRK